MSLRASTVGTLRLSMIAAVGAAERPVRYRSRAIKQATTLFSSPDRNQL